MTAAAARARLDSPVYRTAARVTEQLIARVGDEFGDDFWGFWMLGGMSGGGMGFIFAPHRKAEGQRRLQEIMSATKRELQHAL